MRFFHFHTKEAIIMFQNPRYITRGIADELHPALYGTLWTFIDAMPPGIEKDYLQVFKITSEETGTVVTHSQEVPPYSQSYRFSVDFGFTGTVFAIDDSDHSTMLLAIEY